MNESNVQTIQYPPSEISKCYSCKTRAYLFNRSLEICPCCNITEVKPSDDEEDYIEEYYCKKCKIVFRIGCMHANNGCDYLTYYAVFIIGFTLYGKQYLHQMPIFENRENYIQKMNLWQDNFKPIWICTKNNKFNCPDCSESKCKTISSNCKYHFN